MTLCEMALPQVSFSGWRGACEETGLVAELALWATALVLAAVLVTTLYHLVAKTWQGQSLIAARMASGIAIVVAAFLLAIAAGRPVLLHDRSQMANHIILLVDQSESARRQRDERAARLTDLAGQLEQMQPSTGKELRVSLMDFAQGSEVKLDRGTLVDAAWLLLDDQPAPSIGGKGSDINTALRMARALAQEKSDSDLIVMITDGNTTSASLEQTATELAARLPGIHVWTLNAGAPKEGIVSTYLPPEVESGTEPKLRVVFDAGAQAKDWALSLRHNGQDLQLDQTTVHASDTIESLSFPIRFDGRGLQYVEFEIASGDNIFSHRAFTLVSSPIRVLGVGKTAFLDTLPMDRFHVKRAEDLGNEDLQSYDVIVLGTVFAEALGAENLEHLASLIAGQGTGLLLVNGPMQGSKQDPTVIQSYKDTPIDALLPVSPDPRFLLQDPPPRDTIVLVDTSGSMAGGGLGAARASILDMLSYMREQDSIEVITFGGLSSGRQSGNAAGQGAIHDFISRFPTGDSSDVARAFETALQVTGNYTSVFLITDGEVSAFDFAKAGLAFYYLQYNSGNETLNQNIAQAARQSQILKSGRGLSFKPDFFDPEEKTEYFNPQTITPKVVSALDGVHGGIPTQGVALSYARADATRALISDSAEGEPVLAFRLSDRAGRGSTAAFLSSFDDRWTQSKEGRETIAATLSQLVKWSNQDRYLFRLDDLGGEIGLDITLMETTPSGDLPEMLTAMLVVDGAITPIPLTADPDQRGLFHGRFALLPSESEGTQGLLYVQEGGSGAIEQAQSIPISLPAPRLMPNAGREGASYGINRTGLDALATATGGALDKLPKPKSSKAVWKVPSKPLHPWFVVLAIALFCFAFVAKGSRL